MIKTKITCDYCGKETTNAYYNLFANFDGHVLGRSEICADCWAFAKKHLTITRRLRSWTQRTLRMKLYSETADFKLYEGSMLDVLQVLNPCTVDEVKNERN